MTTSNTPAKRDEHSLAPSSEISKKLVGRLGERYGIAPEALLETLRDTVFSAVQGEVPFSDPELAAALVMCERYGLDPFNREIYCTRNRGRLLIVVGVDGWIKIMNKQATFDGIEFSFTNDDNGVVSCQATIHDKARRHPIVVEEYLDECKRDSEPWKKWPRRMLRHKALIQAVRVAYGISGDVVDEDEKERVVSIRDLGEAEVTRRDPKPAKQVEGPTDDVEAEKVEVGEVRKSLEDACKAAILRLVRAGGDADTSTGDFREMTDSQLRARTAVMDRKAYELEKKAEAAAK